MPAPCSVLLNPGAKLGNSTSAISCFRCLSHGLRPKSKCDDIDNNKPVDDYPLMTVTFNGSSSGMVWSRRDTFAVETAIWAFSRDHGASIGRGALSSSANGGVLTTSVRLPSGLQASLKVQRAVSLFYPAAHHKQLV